jgi:pimeloyl-ACP methyl ester carboxylesterase
MTVASSGVVRHRVALPVEGVGPAGVRRLAADVVHAADLDPSAPTVALTCLPGGGMSRRYFDLQPVGGGDDWSMAAHLAAHGVIVLLIDHPGVGDSDVPDDPYELTPRTVAAVDAHATRRALDALRAGTLVPGLPALTSVRSIGCGHSMGAMLTVHAQAMATSASPLHEAVALLGFAGGGLVEHLSDEERAYAGDPVGLERVVVELTRRRFGRPLSRGSTGPSPFLLAVEVPDHAVAAIADAGSNLLNVCGLTSMVPGASAPQLGAIDVPVFLGVGEFDITGPSHAIPVQFPRARDVTLHVCPQMGHNHNVAPTRAALWDRLLRWLREVLPPASLVHQGR